MTATELNSELYQLTRKYQSELKAVEEKFDRQKKALLDRFAKDNARFCIGDVIQKEDTIIRIKRIETDLCPLPHIYYVGQHLLPDLTEDSNCKHSISEYGNKPIRILDKPEFVRFAVKGETRTVYSTKYRDTLDDCRNILVNVGENVTVYGIKEDGSEVELKKIFSLKKQGVKFYQS